MTEEELKEKMDELGQALYEYELLEREFDYQNKDLIIKISKLKDQLRPVFLEKKTNMRSEKLDVIYRKGAMRWDSKSLTGLIKDYPWLANCRKEMEPTVAFMRREEHDDDGR